MSHIGIFYFSGTGNTALVAGFLKNAFEAQGHQVTFETMDSYTRDRIIPDLTPYDLVGFGHPVLGLGCTRIATDFANLLPDSSGQKGFVFRCCGDPHWLNNNASKPLIRILRRKGMNITHESQYAMAVNFLIRWEDELVLQLYRAAEAKSVKDAREILADTPRELKMPWLLRGVCRSVYFLEEELGARQFGLSLRADDSCTQCGLCVKQCPTGNIRMDSGRIRFGFCCIFCMRCVYSCPVEAIHSGFLGFVIIKRYNGGILIGKVLDNPEIKGQFLSEKTRGYYRHIWEYIRNCGE